MNITKGSTCRNGGLSVILAAVLGLIVSACSPAPGRVLTADEKRADLEFLYTYFYSSYAPLEYKESRFGYHFADLKQTYLDQAAATTNNEDFYAVAFKFVSEFHDAHTSASLVAYNLPGRSQVAYLGFTGKRVGNELLVTDVLPSYKLNSGNTYPIQSGDKITKLDGVALADAVKANVAYSRNLGNDESNLTYHMPRLFNRSGLSNGLPKTANAVVTVKRDDKETNITLPWVINDIVTFMKEQQDAQKELSARTNAASAKAPANDSVFNLADLLMTGKFDLSKAVMKKFMPVSSGYRVWNSFMFVDMAPTWDSPVFSNAVYAKTLGVTLPDAVVTTKTPFEEFQKERNIPSSALFVPGSDTYPTYVTLEQPKDADGNAKGSPRLVATMYLNTFSPSAEEADVVSEVASTLKALQANGVKDIVVDMINNGGGSITLGVKLAQLFSTSAINPPLMRFGINENWINDFESVAADGATDTHRQDAANILRDLKSDRDQKHLRLSAVAYDVTKLMPFELKQNSDLDANFNVTLLVNEMCASMCDIFSGIMQDNGLAKVVGAKTMGAGGNIVQVQSQSPAAQFNLTTTQSLMLRKDGSYVENNGVTPDAEMSVNETVPDKYSPVRDKALEVLFQ